MIIVSYGGGTNSTAMLIECVKRGIEVDLILFADTGGQRPETYCYVEMFSKWLVDNGMPEIIAVKKVTRAQEILTLEDNCLQQKMLPSIAYGFKSCSHKYKIQPQDKYCNNNEKCKEGWKDGKLTKFIGYDADEEHRAKIPEDDKYKYQYPLVEWDMGRDECIETIKEAGLELPGKSACFFCPSSKPHEMRALQLQHPDLAARALKMEANAELTSIKGLGRNWAWRDLLATEDMFDDEYHSIEIACGCFDGG